MAAQATSRTPSEFANWSLHFNSGLTGAGGAREGSQGQAPERAAPGNLPNMPRALKVREDFSRDQILPNTVFCRPFQGSLVYQQVPGAARSGACPWLPSAAPPALKDSLSIHVTEIALSCLILSVPLFVSERSACFGSRFQTFAKNLIS